MSPWVVLTAFVAAINLMIFVALRGHWGRRVWLLAVVAAVGAAAGNAIGSRLGLELLRIGDFHVVAASVVAQVGMLVVDLLGQLGPTRAPR